MKGVDELKEVKELRNAYENLLMQEKLDEQEEEDNKRYKKLIWFFGEEYLGGLQTQPDTQNNKKLIWVFHGLFILFFIAGLIILLFYKIPIIDESTSNVIAYCLLGASGLWFIAMCVKIFYNKKSASIHPMQSTPNPTISSENYNE